MPRSIPATTKKRKPDVLCAGHNADGSPCGRPPSKGREFCHKHGGRVRVGPEHPNFKHGKFSSYMGASFNQAVTKLERDPDLFSMRRKASISDAHLQQLLLQVTDDPDPGEVCPTCGAAWPVGQKARQAFRDHYAKVKALVNNPVVLTSVEKVSVLIEEDYHKEQVWKEIRELQQESIKYAEQEYKQMVAEKQTMNVITVRDVVRQLWEAVGAELTDERVKGQIAGRWKYILDKPTTPLIEG